MLQSSSDTTANSPTPISPFSTYSVASEATSDESPDLGAFTTVFRALNHLQPLRTLPLPPLDGEIASSLPSSTIEGESDAPEGSTVWNQGLMASYLSSASHATTEDPSTQESQSSSSVDDDYGSGSDTEGEPHFRVVVPADALSDIDWSDQPTLGDFEQALSFLATERARLVAQRESDIRDNHSSTSDSAWRHVVEPRRKRRRKKVKVIQILRKEDGGAVPIEVEGPAELDAEESSSSVDGPGSFPHNKSTPSTPPQSKEAREKERASALDSNLRLKHSKSTPTLHLSSTIPPDPHILRLRCLAHKLRLKFPEDYDCITALLTNDFRGGSDFSDPRGPAPLARDTLIHVFIDHSNILIGLLTYLKRHLRHSPRKSRRMSHAALALLLERGRPITRRCLVTSSPLYQPVDTAEQLGYDVRIYARVPDSGDGQDRRHSNSELGAGKNNWRKTDSTPSKPHTPHKGSGNISTESERSGASVGSFLPSFMRNIASSSSRQPDSQQPSGSNNGANPTGSHRIRYREQGVDELLQLKLHQAIADVDVPPPNATIVLATGDGNVGQFNDDGFLGPVRTALKKGWKVELYAWEEGLSRAWKREFADGPFKDRFRIIKMEDFGEDLVELE
ncbi:hypothetical protein SERLA73DRAFT_77737 [Serpula lacrymans var. lacrymans S7.3]|uniref:NYN domain-containing protein n=2 Tax=Serpula lacrymans var. lacrymans TaxID=341189 RepID=F8QAT3_SERL3|nr:uncharacterized protein SERLADRAFT_442637 [Serpula lacrymans var. lacrymans S7.9]EGN94319.1 hypothetical protein SERLA73DRAFT_77737 [Serpula lacrymans var. lacrymans S7.3]EGO19808.1 hypothetical protein SERLADRAFT_442637 [Serpula lacrymans var. lacrymans S7.9]